MDIEDIIEEIKPKYDDFNKDDFVIYCRYMMGFDTVKPDINPKEYYKDLYKEVEMINEEYIMSMMYQK